MLKIIIIFAQIFIDGCTHQNKLFQNPAGVRCANQSFGGFSYFMESEIKKDIIGFESKYQVSSYGNVYSLDRFVNSKKQVSGKDTRKVSGGKLHNQIGKLGYVRVSLSSQGKTKKILLHRLVAINFIPNPENKPCVNHKNGIKTDNNVSNLEWCTHSENEFHSYRTLGKVKINSAETRLRMSVARSGIPLTEEHRLKLCKPKTKKCKA